MIDADQIHDVVGDDPFMEELFRYMNEPMCPWCFKFADRAKVYSTPSERRRFFQITLQDRVLKGFACAHPIHVSVWANVNQ